MFGPLVVAYLFLGGACAGMAALLAGCDLLFGLRRRGRGARGLAWTADLSPALFARGYPTAAAGLALGLLCLLGDLGRPERFLYVLLHPTASVLTFGSAVLGGTLACTTALAAVCLARPPRVPPALVRALELGALACGLATAVYTGVLLAQIGAVALWNPVLAPLFLLSSLSVGAAGALACLLPLDEAPPRLVRALARFDALAVALEALCFAGYLAWAAWVDGQAGLVAQLLAGPGAGALWAGFAVPGLAVPLALEAAYARTRNPNLLAAAVPFVALGGFFLRYCIVNVPYI